MNAGFKIIIVFCFAIKSLTAQTNAGAVVVNPTQAESGLEDIYTIVEEMPEFPGGTAAMQRYIGSTISFPAMVRESGISGKCFIQFVVTSEGKITNLEVLRGVRDCPDCDKEAVRVIKSMPDWKPGKQNGQNVNTVYNFPISFKSNPASNVAIKQENKLSPAEQARHDEAMSYYYKGHKLEQEGKYKEALEKFDQSLAHEPENKFALFDKAKMHLQLGDKKQACDIWNKMITLKLRTEEAEEFIKKHCN